MRKGEGMKYKVGQVITIIVGFIILISVVWIFSVPIIVSYTAIIKGYSGW